MKKFLLFSVFALMSVCMFAQGPAKFSVKAGIGAANFMGKDVEDTDAKLAYKVGVGVELPFDQTWSLQTGLNFASKGCKGDAEGADVTINALYLELPIMAAARMPIGETTNLVLSAGPYLAVGVGGKVKAEADANGVNYSAEYDTFSDEFGAKRFDCGLGIGAHIEMGRIIAGIEGQFGLTKAIKETKARNLAGLVTVGYRF